MIIYVHVKDSRLPITCGSGELKINWLLYAALSCYDPHSYGLQMGIPIGVIKKDGSKLPLTHIIQNSLKDGEEVSIQFRDAVDRFQSRSTRLSKK